MVTFLSVCTCLAVQVSLCVSQHLHIHPVAFPEQTEEKQNILTPTLIDYQQHGRLHYSGAS